MFFKWLAESLHTVGGSSDGECSSGRQKRRGVGDLGSPGKRAAKTATVFYYLLIHLQRSFGRSHVKSKNTTTRTKECTVKSSIFSFNYLVRFLEVSVVSGRLGLLVHPSVRVPIFFIAA